MDIQSLSSQEILDRISRHCPSALCAYLQCINRADQKGMAFFSKDLVEIDMSETWVKFRNQIKKLALENLLEWHPFNNGISITLADYHEND